MQNATKKLLYAIFCTLTLASVIARAVQLYAEANLNLALLILSVLIIIASALISFTSKGYATPFNDEKSKAMSVSCYLAGASLFADFIHQCLNCYGYISENSDLQINYIIPLALLGLSALMSAYYFYIIGCCFRSDTYDFKQLKYFHLMPAAWIFFRLLTCIVIYTDKSSDVETLLQYAVLIFGIIFYLLIVKCIANDSLRLSTLAFAGLIYSAFSVIVSMPRIIVWLLGKSAASVSFTSAAYLFTGIFAFVLSFRILKPKKGTDNVY